MKTAAFLAFLLAAAPLAAQVPPPAAAASLPSQGPDTPGVTSKATARRASAGETRVAGGP
jgi:hypothetical protein